MKKSLIISTAAFSAAVVIGSFVTLIVLNVQNMKKLSSLEASLNQALETSNQNMMKELSAQQTMLKEISENVYNQTAFVSRMIGEALPVIVPEDFATKLAKLEAETSSAFAGKTYEDPQNLTSEYLNYIRTTPPWIQETQNENLFDLRNQLDYLAIMYEYSQTQDVDAAVTALEDLIYTAQDFSKIDTIISKYNQLIEIQNAEYEARKNEAVQTAEKNLKDFNKEFGTKPELSVLEDSLVELSSYSSDEKAAELAQELSQTIQDNTVSEYSKKISGYNEWAINLIESVNKDNIVMESSLPQKNILGMGGPSEYQKMSAGFFRQNLIDKLETIDTSLLFTPTNFLYQQLYQKIWNTLDQTQQFNVSKAILNTRKKGLDNYDR